MKIIDIDSGNTFDVHFAKSAGEEKILCPVCSHLRKRDHQKIKCLSWNHDKGTGFCHNNNEKFAIKKDFKQKEYKRPEWQNNTNLSENIVKLFEERKITQAELRRSKITESTEFMPQRNKEVLVINFNYFRDDKLINIKYRDAKKNFKLYKNAELILYGLDDIKDKKDIIIVEGEMDKLALGSIGIFNVVSVPNGAAGANSKLEYIDNCYSYFENAENIILATDEDYPGIQLRNDLATRLGIERCRKVSFKDCKDVNEFLIKYGTEETKEVFRNFKDFPVEGVFSSADFVEDLRLLYHKGLQPGLKIDIDTIDEFITYEFGRLYTVTGIPGHGKSEFIDYVIERLNILHNLKVAYFSPENHPLQLHASKLIEKITGYRFNSQSLPLEEFEQAESYLRDNYFFINPEDNFEVESILNKAQFLIRSKGVKIFVIDPYNKLEHQRKSNQSETEYISVFLDKLINFTKRNNIITFLVAHPRKMQKDIDKKHEIPTLYDINGSANFYNKTDFGIAVYRDFKSSDSTIYIQKVKFKHLGKVGFSTFMWDKYSGRYIPIINGKAIKDDKNHLQTIIYKTEINENNEDLRTETIDFYDNQENREIGNETPF